MHVWPCSRVRNTGGFMRSSGYNQEERDTPRSTAGAILVCVQAEFRPESPLPGSSPALACLHEDLWLDRPRTHQLDELSVEFSSRLSFWRVVPRELSLHHGVLLRQLLGYEDS